MEKKINCDWCGYEVEDEVYGFKFSIDDDGYWVERNGHHGCMEIMREHEIEKRFSNLNKKVN